MEAETRRFGVPRGPGGERARVRGAASDARAERGRKDGAEGPRAVESANARGEDDADVPNGKRARAVSAEAREASAPAPAPADARRCATRRSARPRIVWRRSARPLCARDRGCG